MSNIDPRLRESLDGLLFGSGPMVDVPPEIAASWQRAMAAGKAPDAFAPPYNPDVDAASRLLRAAAPVLDQLAADLAGTDTSLILCDDRAQVIDRRALSITLAAKLDRIMLAPGFSYHEAHAATNAIGTALVERGPIFVNGAQHFADALTEMACAATPIIDSHSGEILGIIDLTTTARNAQPLMLPFVKRASWEIRQRLLEGSPLIERILYEHFLHARRKAKGPIVVVGEYTMLTNTAASRLLRPVERERLWNWALRAMSSLPTAAAPLTLASGSTSSATCEPIYDSGVIVGAVISLRSAGRGPLVPHLPGRRVDEPADSGWQSLTETERSVAEIVAQGCTNREAAAKLFLSSHTIDTHLRHIFAKLDIDSRVQLARIVPEHSKTVVLAGM
jgi:sigma-54 dependent transcriptional regulator, acetoin dehydrogenase operon transcriptional activator AcoR